VRGKFVSFEGGEGTGKTTQIMRLHNYLTGELGIECKVTREPGGVRIAEQIREIILTPSNKVMDSLTELLLFVAARRQILKELIQPTLESGVWVLSDRYVDSSVVYQGICRNIGVELVKELNNLAIESYMPDLTLYLDIDPEIGLGRVGKRGDLNRLDEETLDFHKRVREGYKMLTEQTPDRLVEINGEPDEETVFKSIKETIHSKLIYID